MKKIGNLTIIDIAIVIFLGLIVVYGFMKTSDTNSNVEVLTFDGSEMGKVAMKYSELYGRGKIVESKISGYNSLNKKKGDIKGEVLWVGYINGNPCILLNVNGKKILAGPYQNKFADFYIDSITLESKGEKNAVDIVISPRYINRLSDLILDIPTRNYELSTNIPIKDADVSRFQKISTELYLKEKYVPITLDIPNERIVIFKATPRTLKIADEILGDLNAQTDFITLRVYDADSETIEKIKSKYNVIKIVNLNTL
ncbi:hypothetical protein [Methanothermobacter sp.]|uniref:hypothetical protein n=1 Tax=Methanothermobacter sp. TaxID=1884223 RepID=UPI0026263A68|nr:hypothetical protein [Methanothermobacter sp.]MDI9614068.1 hypothetical protein [Methanothermobacter sp.]